MFLELAEGIHRIDGTDVEVRATGMSEFYFVSRDTGHPLVEGFAEHDFFMWYDPARDRILPMLATTLGAPDWNAILTSGVVSWGTEGGPAQAAVERIAGHGAYRICQVRLAEFCTNPVARIFSLRLLGLLG